MFVSRMVHICVCISTIFSKLSVDYTTIIINASFKLSSSACCSRMIWVPYILIGITGKTYSTKAEISHIDEYFTVKLFTVICRIYSPSPQCCKFCEILSTTKDIEKKEHRRFADKLS